MLRVDCIKKSFGGVEAIKGSSFEIATGKVTALVGPNGAGKTTLFDIIGGYIRADSGQVFLCDEDISKKDSHVIANKGVSRTFQQVRLFQYLTILDHLIMTEGNDDMRMMYSAFRRPQTDQKKYELLLRDFGIDRTLDTVVSDLSYGQRKLLDLAMAIHRPHTLLMLDEPVAGVNTIIQERIESLLLNIRTKGDTIVLIDHDMGFVKKLADHVIVLDAGHVIVEEKPDDVLRDERVLSAYLGI